MGDHIEEHAVAGATAAAVQGQVKPTSTSAYSVIQLVGALSAFVAAVICDKLTRRPDPLYAPLVGIAAVVLFTLAPADLKLGRFTVPFDMRTMPPLMVALLLPAGMDVQLLWEAPLGTEALCPLKVMAVFYGMAYLCLSVNETGVLRYIALRAAARTQSQGSAFLVVAMVTGAMTLLTSNDIVILTLTPVIIHLCSEKGYDPLPFLYLEFATANIWSVSLLIGNPTNVIAAGAAGLTFGRYFLVLGPVGIVSGLVSVAAIYVRYIQCGRKGAQGLARERVVDTTDAVTGEQSQPEAGQPAREGTVDRTLCWPRAVIASLRLALTLGFAALDDVHHVELWVTASVASGVALVSDAVMDVCRVGGAKGATLATLSGMPWEVLLFALSLFIMVQALDLAGLVGTLATAAAEAAEQGMVFTVASVGVASILACQLLNNQPMTVLLAKVLSHKNFDTAGSEERMAAFGALIVGSNLGANVTLIGALAGPMWVKVCRGLQIQIGHRQFCWAMLSITPAVTVAGLATLCVQLRLLGETATGGH